MKISFEVPDDDDPKSYQFHVALYEALSEAIDTGMLSPVHVAKVLTGTAAAIMDVYGIDRRHALASLAVPLHPHAGRKDGATLHQRVLTRQALNAHDRT